MGTLITAPAIVVHTQRWSESSKIVKLFTPRGMVKVIAKGALRPKSEFRGVVEVLNEIEAVWSVKETRGLQVLISASLVHGFHGIRAHLEKTAVAYAMLEIIQQVIHGGEAFPTLFEYIEKWLSRLEVAGQGEIMGYFWHFLVRLSAELGFALQVGMCRSCEQPLKDFPAYLEITTGNFYCGKCAPSRMSGEGLMLEQGTYQYLARLVQEPLPPTGMDAESFPLTDILLKHLQYHTDIPLQLNALKWLG